MTRTLAARLAWISALVATALGTSAFYTWRPTGSALLAVACLIVITFSAGYWTGQANNESVSTTQTNDSVMENADDVQIGQS